MGMDISRRYQQAVGILINQRVYTGLKNKRKEKAPSVVLKRTTEFSGY